MKPKIEIKRYGNRKHYCTETAAYISMLELSNLVAEGSRAVVTCDLTGKDLTLEALARAFYERVKDRDPEASVLTSADLERLMTKVVRKKVSE